MSPSKTCSRVTGRVRFSDDIPDDNTTALLTSSEPQIISPPSTTSNLDFNADDEDSSGCDSDSELSEMDDEELECLGMEVKANKQRPITRKLSPLPADYSTDGGDLDASLPSPSTGI